MQESSKKSGRKERGNEGEKSQTKSQTTRFPEGSESPYHRLD